jgi:hypothetical protein
MYDLSTHTREAAGSSPASPTLAELPFEPLVVTHSGVACHHPRPLVTSRETARKVVQIRKSGADLVQIPCPTTGVFSCARSTRSSC